MGSLFSAVSAKKRIAFLLILLTVGSWWLHVQYIEHTNIYIPIRADAKTYVLYGYNLKYNGVYSKSPPGNTPTPDSFRSPGYPLLIALTFHLGGEKKFYPILLMIQALLSALLAPLTYYLGRTFLSRWAAFTAATFVAISPHLVAMSSYVLTETLFAFVLLSALACFLKALREKKMVFTIAAGILFGYAYLVNETLLFLPIFFGAMLIYTALLGKTSAPQRITIRNQIIFIIIFLLFPLGWSLRNALVLPPEAGKGSGRALASMTHGTYPDFIYKSEKYKYFPYREDPMQPAFGESFTNFRKILWSRFKERPIRYLSWYLIEKPYYLWSWNILQGQGDVYIYPVTTSLYETSFPADFTRITMKVLHPFILILALSAIVLFARRYYRERNKYKQYETVLPFIVALCVYYTMLYTVFASWSRYSIPFRPELYLLALWSIDMLWQKRKMMKNNLTS